MTEIPIELIKIEPAIATSIYEELLGKMIQKTLHLICVASTDSESIYQKHIISAKRGNNAIFKKEHNLNKFDSLNFKIKKLTLISCGCNKYCNTKKDNINENKHFLFVFKEIKKRFW
jgi:hypothetical protein